MTTNVDHALGAVPGSVVGDALGAPHEFQPPLPSDDDVVMRAGGAFDWELGEWTDDTSMTALIRRLIADERDLADDSTFDELIATWAGWAAGAKDVGNQIRAVLGYIKARAAGAARRAAHVVRAQTGRSGGSESLMRAGPVACGCFGAKTEPEFAATARAISHLTHFDPETGDACVLWSLAIRRAILTGEIDVRPCTQHISADRRETWLTRLDEAERMHP